MLRVTSSTVDHMSPECMCSFRSQLLNCVGPCIVGLNEDIHQLEADRTQRGLAGVQEPPDCEAAEAVRLQRGFQLHAQTVYAALVKESVGL